MTRWTPPSTIDFELVSFMPPVLGRSGGPLGACSFFLEYFTVQRAPVSFCDALSGLSRISKGRPASPDPGFLTPGQSLVSAY